VDSSKKVQDLNCEVQDLLLEVVDRKPQVQDLMSTQANSAFYPQRYGNDLECRPNVIMLCGWMAHFTCGQARDLRVNCVIQFYKFLSRFCQTIIISTSTGPILSKFAGFVELWRCVNDLKLVFRFFKGRCRGNQFCGPNPGLIHRVGFACDSLDGGVRQEVQVRRWTQSNELTNQLTVTNRRLGG